MTSFKSLLAMSPEERINFYLNMGSSGDKRFLSAFIDKQCTLREIKKISPTETVVTFAFKVDRFYCNLSGNLHGGAQASIYDLLTSLALQAVVPEGTWLNGGVSRNLTVTYLRPAPEGVECLVDCEMVHVGKRLSFLRGILKRESDGAVISTCEHNKVAVEHKPGFPKL